jgi:hypothetical protein
VLDQIVVVKHDALRRAPETVREMIALQVLAKTWKPVEFFKELRLGTQREARTWQLQSSHMCIFDTLQWK